MKLKYSGLTASGNTHPKFTRGDIYRDQYGGTVMIKGVEERRVTYRREGYEYDCVMPVYQFDRDFLWCRQRNAASPPAGRKHAPIFRK